MLIFSNHCYAQQAYPIAWLQVFTHFYYLYNDTPFIYYILLIISIYCQAIFYGFFMYFHRLTFKTVFLPLFLYLTYGKVSLIYLLYAFTTVRPKRFLSVHKFQALSTCKICFQKIQK